MYKIAMKKSTKDFKEIIYPRIRSWLGNGRLIPVEAVTEVEMANLLDMFAGIDMWYVESYKGIRGIASRVQWVDESWDTFTVRYWRGSGARTEYEKLANSIEKDWLCPYWFSHAYISKKDQRKLLSVGLCRTKDLIAYIKNGNAPNDYYSREVWEKGHSCFWVVPWGKMGEKYEIKTIPSLDLNEHKKLSEFFEE